MPRLSCRGILDANLLGRRITLDTLVETFLDQHEASPATIGRLKWSLGKATAGLGRLYLDELDGLRIRTWRKSLPESQRHRCLAELRRYSVSPFASGLCSRTPLRASRTHGRQRRRSIHSRRKSSKRSWRTALADSVLVRFLAGTGLRPGEAIALRRGDVDVERRASRWLAPTPKGDSQIPPRLVPVVLCRCAGRIGSIGRPSSVRTQRRRDQACAGADRLSG